MPSISLAPLFLLLLGINMAMGTSIGGTGKITPQDYAEMGQSLVRAGPACEIPYSTLDLNRIAAVEGLVEAEDCGACLLVSSTEEPSKMEYVLAVDGGGEGLDVSKAAFGKLFGTAVDSSSATWAVVNANHCLDIIRGSFAKKHVRLAPIQDKIDKMASLVTNSTATSPANAAEPAKGSFPPVVFPTPAATVEKPANGNSTHVKGTAEAAPSVKNAACSTALPVMMGSFLVGLSFVLA